MKKYLSLIILILSTNVFAVSFENQNNVFFNNGILTDEITNVAVKGFDPVSYFKLSDSQPRPLEGNDQYQSVYKGMIYKFSSAENKADFDKNPEQYLPQHGGFCAYAMTAGEFADIDPYAFVVHDGKLYLNKNEAARDFFKQNLKYNVERADIHWDNFVNHVPHEYICDKLTQSHFVRFASGAGVHLNDNFDSGGLLSGFINGATNFVRHFTETEDAENLHEAFPEFAFENGTNAVDSNTVGAVCKPRIGGDFELIKNIGSKNMDYYTSFRRSCKYIPYDIYNIYVTLGGDSALRLPTR